jgi:hypothetical protein
MSTTAMDKHVWVKAEYRAKRKTVQVPFCGFVKDTIKDICGGLRSTKFLMWLRSRLKE